MKKGSSIQQFLQKCLEQLRREFNELKTASMDRLMYIKEDLIIAHHYTFYDFIVTKVSAPVWGYLPEIVNSLVIIQLFLSN